MIKSFILGNPRSGTSLLRIMLNAHPQILAAPESGFMEWWHNKYSNWSSVDNKNELKVDEYVQDVLSSKKIETWDLDPKCLNDTIKENNPRNYGELSQCVYLSRAKHLKKEAQVIVDKNNYYIHCVGKLQEIWGDAKYIHLIRDGRDVACSYIALKSQNINSKYKPQLSSDISQIAKEWLTNNQKILFEMDKMPEGQCISIKYEDMLKYSEQKLKSLCDFLGVNFNKRMLEYYKYNDEPGSTLEWKKKTLQKPQVSNIAKYKTILTQAQIDEFNDIAGDMLERFGYV